MNDTDEDIVRISNKLLSYLKEELKDSGIGYSSGLEKLSGGHETSTYRFRLNGAHEDLSQPLVLRLYPEFSSLDKVMWESTIQSVLAEEGLPVAKAGFVNIDKSILGKAFFIMEYLRGSDIVGLYLSPPDNAVVISVDEKPAIQALERAQKKKGDRRIILENG